MLSDFSEHLHILDIRVGYICIRNAYNYQNMILYFTVLLLSDFTCQEAPEGNKKY